MIKSNIQSVNFKMAVQQNSKLMFVAIVLFLLMPIVGILFAATIVIQNNIKDKRIYFFLFLLMALYMGVINVTKTPASDQVQYMNAYMQIPNQTLFESLTNIYGDSSRLTYKEMGYGLLNFLGYYISFGNYKLFIIEFTVFLYMLLMISIYKFFTYLEVYPFKYYIISAIFILCFFSQFFNITIHLQRQIIATAVMIWALIDTTIKQKVNWFIALIAVTLHTSVALFLPVFAFVYFRKRLKVWHIFCLMAIFCLSMSILSSISSVFLSLIGGDVYGLSRLANAGTSIEDRFNTNIMLFFSIPLLYISIRELWKNRYNINNSINLLFIAYCFLICFSYLNPDNTMQYRYFMMSYSFMPFILPLMFKRNNNYRKIYLFLIAAFFLFRFYETFEDMVWDYASVEDVLLKNYIWFLFYR